MNNELTPLPEPARVAPVLGVIRSLFTSDQMRVYGDARAAVAVKQYADAAPLCDKHKPSGGVRGGCVICAGEKLHSAVSRISYACELPNETECSSFDIHADEAAVVDQVKAAIADAQEEIEGLSALNSRLSDLLHRVAIALRGPELPLAFWSFHDLPELAASTTARERERERCAKIADALGNDKRVGAAIRGIPTP